MLKSTPAWKSTLPPLVAVVTNMISGRLLNYKIVSYKWTPSSWNGTYIYVDSIRRNHYTRKPDYRNIRQWYYIYTGTKKLETKDFLSLPSPIIGYACHSLTHCTDWLTDSCLVNLIDVILACVDANLKLVDVVTVADVDGVDHVGNSLLHIWELWFGHKAKLLFTLWAQGLTKI